MEVIELIKLEKKVDRILFYLESDDKTNQTGLIEQVSEMRRELADLILWKKVLNAKVTILGGFGGSLFFAISWLVQHFFINKK